jgi:flagellar basal-body rod protein FlgG
MTNSLYTAKTGLEGQQRAMDVISNNLANVNTTGFKRGQAVFQDLMYQTLRQPGSQVGDAGQLPTGLQVGTGARVVATVRNHVQGGVRETGSSTDLMISGKGFFQVEMPDGSFAFSRDGALSKDQNGQLVTAGGYVIQPPINIPDNALTITVAKDGNVSVTQPGATGNSVQVGQLQLATFISEEGLQNIGENLYVETDSSGVANMLAPGLDGAGTLTQGSLETSNVNVAEELVNMITTQRAFEMNSKAVQTSDQMLARLTQL